MLTVTLIETHLPEPGAEFVYNAEGCAGCPYCSHCLNLDGDTRYRITDVHENAQMLECAIYDGGVRETSL